MRAVRAADADHVLLSLIVVAMLAVPLVLLAVDLIRGARRGPDGTPPAPSYGDQLAGRH